MKYYSCEFQTYRGYVHSMKCPNCDKSNPDENRFCGACGAELTEEPPEIRAFLRDELPRQIEQAINAKLAVFTDRESIELKATEQIIDRVWKWVTRLATVVVGVVTVLALALGIWGLNSFENLKELESEAGAKLVSARESAENIEKQANLTTERLTLFDSQVEDLQSKTAETEKTLARSEDTVADLSERLEEATKTVERAESLETEVRAALRRSQEVMDAFSQRAGKLDKQLNVLSEKVKQLGDMATQTAEYVAAATPENPEGEIKASSDRVKARVRFEEAYKEDDLEKKLALYTEAIELDPEYVFAYNNRGNAYADKGNYDQAIADYDKAIELDPDYANAFYNRGIAHSDKGDHDRAIADYTRAIELDPDNAFAHHGRGDAHAAKDDHDRAIADYDRAIELNPDYANAYVNRGYAYAAKGDYDRAIADYGRGIELDPQFANAYNNRGNVYGDKGEYDKAIADYDRAIELDPQYATAFNNKAWLLATARNARFRDGEEAIRLAQDAVRLEDSPDNRDTLAAAYAEAGQFDDAVAAQERAIEMLRAAGRSDQAAAFRTRLDLYRSRQPYRE